MIAAASKTLLGLIAAGWLAEALAATHGDIDAGVAAYKAGDNEAALTSYAAAEADLGERPEIHFDKGLALLAKDDKEGARKDAPADAAANAQNAKPSDKPDAAQQQALKQDVDRALAGKDKTDDHDGKPVAAQESEDDATREKRQALEHWLERVPDDPGGLLRRKFQLEYQRRQQRGGDGG
jgi:hypothetical protein